jgi:hypothetical protein
MSRYLEVKACCDCPFNKCNDFTGQERCTLKERLIIRDDDGEADELSIIGSFPVWCPLKGLNDEGQIED